MAKILLNVEINNALAKKQLSELEKSIETIASSLNKVKVNKDLSTQINSLTKYYKALAKAATSATTATEKRRLSEQKFATEVKRTLTQAQKERAATANAEKAVVSLTKAKMQLAQASEKVSSATKQGTKAIEENTKANEKQKQSIFSMAKGFAEWQVAAALVMRPLNLLRSAVQSIGDTLVETEDRVIELKRVLSENISNKQVSDQLYKIAQQYGQTFDNVSEIALNFARAGMSWVETIQATEAAVLALNVAELDASEASDGLISIMNQFGLEANELTLVIDKLNKTADNFPVTTEKILSALQRTGSAAKNANLDLDETVSLVTALSKATNRSGENIGTALNSLIQFSTKDTALDTFAKLGGGVQTAVENYRKGVGDVLDIWRELSTVIQSRNNSSQNILGGLFGDDDWRSLNEELQDALGENFATVTEIYDTASTFRKNYFIALLDNMDAVEEAMKVMDDAAGYSAKENEQYLDTYTAKVNMLKAKWEELANDEQGLLGLKKALVDIGIGVLDIVEGLGGLIPTLRTIAILVGTIVAIVKFDSIVSGIGKIATTITSIIPTIQSFIVTLKGAQQGIISLSTAAQAASVVAKSALGVVGLVLAAVSVGVGLWQKYNQEQAEARAQAIQTWEAHKEEAKSLDDLLEKYKSYTDYSSTEAKQTEKEMLSLLGEKANVLSDLTEGTDDYREALIKLSEQQKQIYLAEKNAAVSAAKTNLSKANVGGKFQHAWYVNDTADILEKAGIGVNYYNLGEAYASYSISGLSSEKNEEAQLRNYQILLDAQAKLSAAYNKATDEGNQKEAKKIKKVWQMVQAAIADAEGSVNAYKNALQEAKDATDTIKNATDDLANTVQDLSAASDSKIKSLLEKLTAQRDAIKSAHDEEEKRKAVLEAENKLLDAQNEKIKAQKQLLEAMENRNVRVYNAQTGQWEWNANAKTVENAKEQVEKAQENIEKAQEDLDKARYNAEIAAYDEIIKYLENGGRDIDELKKIFEKWQIAYNGTLLEGEPKFLTDIMEAFEAVKISLKKLTGEDKKEEKEPEKKPTTSKPKKDPPKIDFGVDKWGISTPTKKGSSPNTKRSDYIYDNGGILEGMGGIKATSRPEMVLPPEITEKLLEPTNNERFKNIAKAMGIMIHDPFQSLQPIDTRNIIRNYGGNTDNRNYDNRNYHINGVPISTQMAETHTLKEIIDCFSLIPND